MIEKIEGYISHITYKNAENGYTVCTFITGEKELTCVGILPLAEEGQCFFLEGELTVHSNYGEQFRIENYEETDPGDAISMERYLGSGTVKGVGPALAARIVRRFGIDTFRILDEEPERLGEIKGISNRMAMEISQQVEEKKEMRKAMMFLQQYGLSINLCVKIYRAYNENVYAIIRENPYRIADDIPGVGFRIADEIARKAGIRTDSDFRIRSGILYTLLQASNMGHTFLPQQELSRQTAELLKIEGLQIDVHYENLAMERKVVIQETDKGKQIYAAHFFYLEKNVASMISSLNRDYGVNQKEVEKRIQKLEAEVDVSLDPIQKQAVLSAAGNGMLIVTGGPGTGKTTTINFILKYFEEEGQEILLGAPTGRAAKRMSEMTGYEAKTIHRLLEVNGGSGEMGGFERNAENPLEADVIIIDEMSMVDISLMYALLSAIMPGTKLILVGDANQLPSVGPGRVLQDMMDSRACTIVELKKIFRQAEESSIVMNSHRIHLGQEIELDNKNMDFFFLKRYSADVILNVTLELIMEKLPKFVGASPLDIQVLTPMKKGLLGVERCNKILQTYLNPKAKSKIEFEYGETLFREGDKVMQIKNNYQLEWEIRNKYSIALEKGVGIFNGDIGIIRQIDLRLEQIMILFDDKTVMYSFKQLEELELAYAITIHKSQGSEYPAVILPLLSGPRMLLNRNLLYTAVTRAKKCVTIVGDEKVFNEMIRNETEQTRYSGLKDRIREVQSI